MIHLLFFMNSFVVQYKSQWDSEEKSYKGALHNSLHSLQERDIRITLSRNVHRLIFVL